MKTILVIAATCVALSGCAHGTLVAYIQQHAAAFAAVGVVAGTTTTVLGAVNAADETAQRVERRIEKAD